MWVYNNGTSVVDAVTHLSSLTLDTDLAVSQGGTGASTFTSNGVLLGNGTSAISATAAGTTGQVLVGNTGSAPTWATLTGTAVTSISFGTTGLTPSTATQGAVTVAGTLGVANGGTGTATTFTAGSVVFAGASGVYTQDNANLFWDNTNDRLGIGTATPSSRLDLGSGDLRFSGTGQRILADFSNGTVSNRLAFQSTTTNGNTNVHIIPNGTSVAAGLNVETDSALTNGQVGNIAIIGTTDFRITSTLRGTGIYVPMTFYTGGSERIRVDTSGNVGVGTATPSFRLTVAGGASDAAWLNSSGTLSLLGLGGYSGGTDGAFSLRYDRATGVTTFNGGSRDTPVERMRIDASGNVGIGTSSPASLLDVAGTIRSGVGGSDPGTGAVFYFVGSGAFQTVVGGAAFAVNTGANNARAERMRIDSSGNVGIGTTAPGQTLQIVNAGNYQFRLGAGSTFNYDIGRSTSDGLLYFYGNQSGFTGYVFSGADGERMRITGNGSVAIGTSTPVSGRILTVNGSPTFISAGSTFNIDLDGSSGANGVGLEASFAAGGYGPLRFRTGGAESARIDASGNLLVGKTSTSTSVTGFVALPTGFTATNANAEAGDMNRQSSDGDLLLFRRAQTQVGSVTVSTTATTYTTSSDYRLKNVDGPITNSGAYIDALKPVQGSWKVDGSRFIGLLAHEVQEVSETQIATGEKDGEKMQAMDYSAPEIIANLIAELQSLRARVAQLEGK
jgi:hypothetical protein